MNGSPFAYESNGISGNPVYAYFSGTPIMGNQYVKGSISLGNLLVNAGPVGMGVMARYNPSNNRAYYLAATAANPGVNQNFNWSAGVVGFPGPASQILSGTGLGSGVSLLLVVTGVQPSITVSCYGNGNFLGSFNENPPSNANDKGIGGIVGGFGSFSGGGVFCLNFLTMSGFTYGNWGIAPNNGSTPAAPSHRRGSGYERKGFVFTPNSLTQN
jgi:hypothetical protein